MLSYRRNEEKRKVNMDRLTKNNREDNKGDYYYPECFERCDGLGASEKCDECDFCYAVCEKLGKYEDLEEQGLLLRLPCNIGDTIYEVSYENREFVIKEHIVKEFIYRTYRFARIEIYCENENGFLVCNNIGKLDECLFLTQAEAEQKLKEMENR